YAVVVAPVHGGDCAPAASIPTWLGLLGVVRVNSRAKKTVVLTAPRASRETGGRRLHRLLAGALRAAYAALWSCVSGVGLFANKAAPRLEQSEPIVSVCVSRWVPERDLK
ncbi:hypothetical protein HK405_015249, partial [Cladochytrium tenue]